MTRIITALELDGTPLVRLENDHLQVDVAPTIGGRIVNILNRATGHQYLWHNKKVRLCPSPPGSVYDPRFFGGIDELIPGDIPEEIAGVACSDHGELWTTPLEYNISESALSLAGMLPLLGVHYERRMTLRAEAPLLDLDYRIENRTSATRYFMWKMHCALAVEPGDVIECPAEWGQVIDQRWTRWSNTAPFRWPHIDAQRADLIVPPDNTVDFLRLYGLRAGRMGCLSEKRGLAFGYFFDRAVFPWPQYYATFGGLDGLYTAVLEPCTCMPLSVSEAIATGQCTRLAPGEAIETRLTIYAGTIGGYWDVHAD